MPNEQMDFYISTLWSIDSIDSFYFRTHPTLMKDHTRAIMAVDEGLGYLAHLDWDWQQPFDPYRLALAAKDLQTRLPLLAVVLLTERLVQLGVLDSTLCLRAELAPILERYRRGFAALEVQEIIDAPLRVLGMGAQVAEGDLLYPMVLGACRNEHKQQYALARHYQELQKTEEKNISYYETLIIYWLRRAARGGNAYAVQLLERREREKRRMHPSLTQLQEIETYIEQPELSKALRQE